MNKFAQFLLLLALPLALANCGKTEEKKAQEEATSLTEEQNRLATEVTNTIVSDDWNEDQLKAFESKLNRLEAVEGQLLAHNGRNGVTVYGQRNTYAIAQRRMRIADVRTARIARTATAERLKSDLAQKVEARKRLAEEINQSAPDMNWSVEDLEKLEKKLNALQATGLEIELLSKVTGDPVVGGGDESAIAPRKEKIALIRAEKADVKTRADLLLLMQNLNASFDTLTPPGRFASARNLEVYQGELDNIERRLDVADATKILPKGDAAEVEIKRISADLRQKLAAAREAHKIAG